MSVSVLGAGLLNDYDNVSFFEQFNAQFNDLASEKKLYNKRFLKNLFVHSNQTFENLLNCVECAISNLDEAIKLNSDNVSVIVGTNYGMFREQERFISSIKQFNLANKYIFTQTANNIFSGLICSRFHFSGFNTTLFGEESVELDVLELSRQILNANKSEYVVACVVLSSKRLEERERIYSLILKKADVDSCCYLNVDFERTTFYNSLSLESEIVTPVEKADMVIAVGLANSHIKILNKYYRDVQLFNGFEGDIFLMIIRAYISNEISHIYKISKSKFDINYMTLSKIKLT